MSAEAGECTCLRTEPDNREPDAADTYCVCGAVPKDECYPNCLEYDYYKEGPEPVYDEAEFIDTEA